MDFLWNATRVVFKCQTMPRNICLYYSVETYNTVLWLKWRCYHTFSTISFFRNTQLNTFTFSTIYLFQITQPNTPREIHSAGTLPLIKWNLDFYFDGSTQWVSCFNNLLFALWNIIPGYYRPQCWPTPDYWIHWFLKISIRLNYDLNLHNKMMQF